MSQPQTESELAEAIDRLEDERSGLRRREGDLAGRDDELAPIRVRLEEIRVELDRLYDLRHQRQGLRDAGLDPDTAVERDASTVENYEG